MKKQPKRKSAGRQRDLRSSVAIGTKISSFTYRTQRAEETTNTGRQIDKKDPSLKLPRLWPQRLASSIVLILILVLFVNSLVLNNKVKILASTPSQTAEVEANQSAYAKVVEQYMQSSFFHHNKITISSGAVAKALTSRYPDIASASVSLPILSKTAKVYIQPVQPSVIMEASNGAFLLDINGRVLQMASSVAGLHQPATIPTVANQSNLSLKVGQTALTAANITFIKDVTAELASKGYAVSSMSLPPSSSELDVYLTGKVYYIKFNLETNDVRQQTGTFLATIHLLSGQNITPTKYVDVRLDGRAYYQ